MYSCWCFLMTDPNSSRLAAAGHATKQPPSTRYLRLVSIGRFSIGLPGSHRRPEGDLSVNASPTQEIDFRIRRTGATPPGGTTVPMVANAA